MANLIQASVYQIDGAPLPSAITLDFQTSNLVIREASIVGTSAVNSAILYYNLPNNQLSVQTFYVGESIAELVAAANVGSTTQLQATVLEINEDPQVPGGVQYSFPANEILVGESVNAVTGVNSYIQFKNFRYFVSELQANLLVSGNGASAYKVYTALLTQSGGDSGGNLTGEPGNDTLTIGVTYWIIGNSNNVDFTNVGAPNNNQDTYFVATGTTPNSWGDSVGDPILGYNTGAPVVTVLENTIGNITWGYVSTGNYLATLTGAFPSDKTFITTPSQLAGLDVNGSGVGAQVNPVDNINVYSADGGSNSNGILNSTPIEIRIYN